jgi:hypothetical protein
MTERLVVGELLPMNGGHSGAISWLLLYAQHMFSSAQRIYDAASCT